MADTIERASDTSVFVKHETPLAELIAERDRLVVQQMRLTETDAQLQALIDALAVQIAAADALGVKVPPKPVEPPAEEAIA